MTSLLGNPGHRFRPRIIRREINPVGKKPGNQSQIPPPVQCFVSWTAEDRVDLIARIFLIYRIIELLEAQPVVSVIHDGHQFPVAALELFHPSLHLHIGQSLLHGVHIHPVGISRRDGSQRIFHIEKAVHPEIELLMEPVAAHPEGNPSPVHLDIVPPDIRRSRGSEGQHLLRNLRGRKDSLFLCAVQIHAGHLCLLEKRKLRGKIILEIFMLAGADVILGDVEEDPHIKFQPPYSLIFQRLAGDLHRQITDVLVRTVPDMAVDFHSLRRSHLRRYQFFSVVDIHGGKDACLLPLLLLLPDIQDRLNIIGSGRLSLGSRDAGEMKRQRLRPVENGRQHRHGLPDIFHLNPGGLFRKLVPLLAHITDTAPLQGLL